MAINEILDDTRKKTSGSGKRNERNQHNESQDESYNDGREDSISSSLKGVIHHHEKAVEEVSHFFSTFQALDPARADDRNKRMMRKKILKFWKTAETTFQTIVNAGCHYDTSKYEELAGYIGDLEFEEQEECSQSTPGNAAASKDDGIRIPKVEVPQFEGDILEWTSFKALFNQMIGSKANLTNTQKMVYLMQNVKGEAHKIVTRLQICDGSYAQAWALLDDRYSSEHRITTYLTDKLMNLEHIKPNNANSLTNLLNVVNQCISGLINVGVDANHDSLSIFLHNIVADKIDKHTLAFYENKIVKSAIENENFKHVFEQQHVSEIGNKVNGDLNVYYWCGLL